VSSIDEWEVRFEVTASLPSNDLWPLTQLPHLARLPPTFSISYCCGAWPLHLYARPDLNLITRRLSLTLCNDREDVVYLLSYRFRGCALCHRRRYRQGAVH
jgi:hypothetical protein